LIGQATDVREGAVLSSEVSRGAERRGESVTHRRECGALESGTTVLAGVIVSEVNPLAQRVF
jgi:hypothetical protein